MAKSADAFRTISEVSEWLDTPAHVLRFWESKFSQVKPVKRAGGRRYYRPSDMELLGGIKRLLHEDGMTIKGVQKLLREKGLGHVSDMSQPLDVVTAAVRDAMDGRAKAAEAARTAPQEDAKTKTLSPPSELDVQQGPAASEAPEPPAGATTESTATPEETGSPVETTKAAPPDVPVSVTQPATKTHITAVAIEKVPTVLSLVFARKTALEEHERVEVRHLASRLQSWLARQSA